MRVGGQIIWATPFNEARRRLVVAARGRDRSLRPLSLAIQVSLAIALCEGEITHVGRIWADGVEIAPS